MRCNYSSRQLRVMLSSAIPERVDFQVLHWFDAIKIGPGRTYIRIGNQVIDRERNANRWLLNHPPLNFIVMIELLKDQCNDLHL